MEKQYCMIIGDLVDSKKINIDERYKLQEKLKKELEKINFDYDMDICSRFCITLGDELQGGLFNTINLFDILDRIKNAVYPQKIRFGIGLGQLNTYVKMSDSFGADGIAYYNARKGMEELKKEDTFFYGYRIVSQYDECDLLNPMFKLIDTISSSWTEKQYMYMLMANNTDCEISTLAKYLEVSVSTLSRTLSRANNKLVLNTLDKISSYLFENYDTGENQDKFLKNYNYACKKYKNDDYDATIEILNSVKPIDEVEKSNYYLLRSMCFTKLSKHDLAIENADKGFINNTDFLHRNIKLKNIYSINCTEKSDIENNRNLLNEALLKIQEAEQLIEYDSNLMSWKIYTQCNKARIYKRMGEVDKAKDIYEAMLVLTEENFDRDKLTYIKIQSNICDIYLNEKKYSVAYELLKNITKLGDIYLNKQSTTLAILKIHFSDAAIHMPILANNREEQKTVFGYLMNAKNIFDTLGNVKAVEECNSLLEEFFNITGVNKFSFYEHF